MRWSKYWLPLPLHPRHTSDGTNILRFLPSGPDHWPDHPEKERINIFGPKLSGAPRDYRMNILNEEHLMQYLSGRFYNHASVTYSIVYILLVRKKREKVPKIHNWTCDTVLQPHGQNSSRKNNYTSGSSWRKVTLFVISFPVKTHNFLQFWQLFRTHKFHFLSFDIFFPDWRYVECMASKLYIRCYPEVMVASGTRIRDTVRLRSWIVTPPRKFRQGMYNGRT
jgi:hypothetical protein